MPKNPRDAGFTLVEAVVTIGLLGIMMAIAVGGYRSWAFAHEQAGTARTLQSALRQAQQRAVTEGTAACVAFDVAAGTYTVYRGACGNAANKVDGPTRTASRRVHLDSPDFTGPSGTPPTAVTFTARGTAWAGQVRVTRDKSSEVYVIGVEGLTGRVSLCVEGLTGCVSLS